MAALGELVGVSVPREVEPVAVALLLGIVTDYHLFILSRFRALLGDGNDRRAAASAAGTELFPVVLTAGSIIALASLALLTADIGFVRAFGPGMAVAALVAVAVTLTFIPAVLALGGDAVLWPSAAKGAPARRRRVGFSRRAVALSARRPTAVALASALALLACSAGVLGMKLGYPLLRGLPAEAEAKRGYRDVVRAFGPGAVAPTLALLEADGIEDEPRRLEALTRALSRTSGVQAAIGPPSLPAAASPLTLDEEGDAARLVFILDHDPFSDAGLTDLRRLRRVAPRLLRVVGLGDARVSFAGDTAITSETVGRTAAALLDVAPLSLLVVALLLAVLLRALVAPIYIVAANLLAVLAALGLTVIFFQGVLDVPDLSFFVPFAAAVLLLALGSDYSVFIVSRVWDAARRLPLRAAVTEAGGEAAAAITTAGLILAGSFAALALIPLQSFQQLAFAMTTGLLLDAFLVRGLLIPALIVRVGPVGAWPGKLSAEAVPDATSA